MTAAIDYRIAQLAEQLDEVRQALADRTPQLGNSALHDGSIGEYVATENGDQLVARYGRQWDGAHTAVSLAGPPPPTPAAAQIAQIPSGFAIRWGGDWQPLPAPNADEVPTPEIAPSDFTRVEVHLGTDPTPGFLFTTYRKPIESSRGGEVEITGLDPDVDHYIWLVARTQSGKFSEPSQVVGPVRPGKLQANQFAIDLDAIGGNTIHRGPVAPGGEHRIGDLWLQTPDNIPNRWEGDPPEWTPSRDAGIAQAIDDAFAARQTAEQAGIDSLAALGTAQSKLTVYRQASPPTGGTYLPDTDLWIDSDDNKLHIATTAAGDWTPVQDAGIQTAITNAAAAQSTADGKMRIFPQTSAPTGLVAGDVGDLWIDIDDGNKSYTWALISDTTYGWVARQLGNAAIQPQSLIASDVIATGTVTAALLEAIVVLAGAIIGGNPTGNHVRLDTTGLRVYSVDPDGQVVETGRWGTSGGDRILIMKNNRPVASIDQDGGGSLKSLDVDEDITVGGNSLTYILDQRPRGLLVRGGIESSTTATTTALGTFDVEFLAEPGRAYRISTSTINLSLSTTSTYGFVALVARPSAEGPPAFSAGKQLVAGRGSASVTGGTQPFVLSKVVGFNELFSGTPPTVPTRVRVLLTYGVVNGGGTAAFMAYADYPVHLSVEDVGLSRPFTGVLNNGGGSTAAPVTQQQLDFASTWARNWQSTTTAPRTDTPEMVQGYTPYYTAPGSGVGQFGFQDLTGVLNGATINWMAVYIYATHWYSDSGGTAMLGAHPYLNAPASRPADWQLNLMRGPAMSKPGGAWIYIPSGWFAGFISGANRGFTLGNLATTVLSDYGRFAADPADSRRPVLRINFTK